jgi:hypothetical protein
LLGLAAWNEARVVNPEEMGTADEDQLVGSAEAAYRIR